MKMLLRIAVSAALLALLFARFDFKSIAEVCLRADPRLLLVAFGFFLASQLLSAFRWMGLAHGIGFRVRLARYTQIYLIGMFFGIVFPSTLGADAARALYLGQRAPGRAHALSSVLFDRLTGLVMLAAVAAGALALGPSEHLPNGLEATVVALATLLVAGWLALPMLVKVLPEHQRWRRLVEDELTPYFRDPRLAGVAAFLSLIVHGLQIVSQKMIASSIGLKVPFAFIAIYHPLVSLAGALPFTIGGFGLREAAYAYLLPYAGVNADDAIALGLLWWAVGAFGGLFGGAIYAFSGRERIELRRAQSAHESPEPRRQHRRAP